MLDFKLRLLNISSFQKYKSSALFKAQQQVIMREVYSTIILEYIFKY